MRNQCAADVVAAQPIENNCKKCYFFLYTTAGAWEYDAMKTLQKPAAPARYLSRGCKQMKAHLRRARRELCEEYNEPNPHRATLLFLADMQNKINVAKAAAAI